MRRLIVSLIAAALWAAPAALAQDAQGRKIGARDARSLAVWAVSYEPPAAAPPGRPAGAVVLVAHHDLAGHDEGHHGAHDKHKCEMLHKICDWLCYRRSSNCCKGCGCCY